MIRLSNRKFSVDLVDALAIVCFRLAKPTCLTNLCKYTGHCKSWDEVFNITLQYLAKIFERFLYWDYIYLTPDKLVTFAKATEKSGAGRTDLIRFIDGIV